MTIQPTLEQTYVAQERRIATAIPGPKSQAIMARRDRAVSSGMGCTMPVSIERSAGAILVDADGNHIIDMAAGIGVNTLGNANPYVVEAVKLQAGKFLHTCYASTQYELYTDVCEWLNEHTPGSFEKRSVLFTTGTEAVENAVKIARHHTRRPNIISFEHAYHGRTYMALALTAKEDPYRRNFGPLPGNVHRTPYPYSLRWPTGGHKAADEAIAALEELIADLDASTIAAIILEPIQGEGGFIVPPSGFLARVQALTNRHGIVFIVDEIQTGMGRTGTLFACEHDEAVPDLLLSAKALAGGAPLSAVTGRSEILNSVHFNGLGGTYGGNPLACAAAVAVFAQMEDGSFLRRALEIEQIIRDELTPLIESDPRVAEVRGRGAMMAIEFVRYETLEPDSSLAKSVAAICHSKGVSILVCGTYSNVIRMLPPLVISDDLLLDALAVLKSAISSTQDER